MKMPTECGYTASIRYYYTYIVTSRGTVEEMEWDQGNRGSVLNDLTG